MSSLQAIKHSRPRQVWGDGCFRLRNTLRDQTILEAGESNLCTEALTCGTFRDSILNLRQRYKMLVVRVTTIRQRILILPTARSLAHTGPVPSERFEPTRSASTAGRGQQKEIRGVRQITIVCSQVSLSGRKWKVSCDDHGRHTAILYSNRS